MPRSGMSTTQIDDEIWGRRERGDTMAAIGAAVGLGVNAVYYRVQRHGGVRPRPHHRAPRTLSAAEREEISRGLAAGWSFAAIGRRLQRPTSTISREVGRHGGRRAYRARRADQRAWRRAARPKPCRLATCRPLQRLVVRGLERQWSPQQIAGWLRSQYPDNPQMQVSHETIYLSLYVQARGALKRSLTQHLRRHHLSRRPRRAAAARTTRIRDALSIAARPPEVADRAVPGHWEGDLLRGAHYSHVATLVERQSRFLLVLRVPRPDATTVAHLLARRVRTLPTCLRQSLTWDRGTEMAAHQTFTIATGVQVYFCDPRSPWQRGSNENTNGLLRQYLPAGTDLAALSQAQLNRIATKLNTRPRKTLNYETPAERLAAIVASTA